MSISWNAVEREERALEEDLAAGLISYEQYRAGMRDLRDEIQGTAQEDAEQAYRGGMGWN